MIKLLINLLAVLCFFSEANAQVDENVRPPRNTIPEDSMVYMRNGKSIARFPNPETVTMNSLGYLRYSENIIYGFETNSFFSNETSNRMTNFELLFGYRHIWNRMFLPYAMVGFGPCSFKNELNSESARGEGISVTVDFGFDVLKIMNFKNSIGIRNTNSSFSSKDMNSASFLDLYWTLGFVF